MLLPIMTYAQCIKNAAASGGLALPGEGPALSELERVMRARLATPSCAVLPYKQCCLRQLTACQDAGHVLNL